MGSPDSDAPGEVTQLLARVSAGEVRAREQLAALVYDELHQLARRVFGGQPAHHTLQPTALVSEAWLKLVKPQALQGVRDRSHFRAVAAAAMRQILVDHARRKNAKKRDSGMRRVTLSGATGDDGRKEIDVIALHEALERLGELDPRQARIVELRYFGGLTVDEVAEVIGVTPRTIHKEWRRCKAWLRAELRE